MHIEEAVRLEEIVRGQGERVADARNRANGVGARAQVHEAAQVLHVYSLLAGQRVLAGAVVAGPHVQHLGHLQLHFLRVHNAAPQCSLLHSMFCALTTYLSANMVSAI